MTKKGFAERWHNILSNSKKGWCKGLYIMNILYDRRRGIGRRKAEIYKNEFRME